MRPIALGMLTLAATIVLTSGAEGNGGTLRVDRAPAGPYLVSVWTESDPPRVGWLDVSVAVMRLPDGEPVLDVEARLRAAMPAREDSERSVALARGGGGNLLLYHGEVEVPAPGRWSFTLEVAGPAGGGATAFDLEVREAAIPEWILVTVAVVLLSAVVGSWLRARARRRTPRG